MTARRNWGVAVGVAVVVGVGTIVGVLGGRLTQRAPRAAGLRVVVLDVATDDDGARWVQDAASRALGGRIGLSVVSVEELRARRVTLLRAHRAATDDDAVAELALDAVVSAAVHGGAVHLEAHDRSGKLLAAADSALEVDAVFRAAGSLAAHLLAPADAQFSAEASAAQLPAATTTSPTQNVAAYRAYAAGIFAWDAGDVAGAAVKLREATALDDGFAPAWAALATALDVAFGQGTATSLDAAGVTDAAQKAQAKRSSLSGLEALLVDAALAARAGRTEDAMAALRGATVAYPEDRAGHFALGRAYHRMLGAHDEALHHLETARRITPSWLPVTAEIADAWLAMGDRKHAAQAVRGYLVLVPDDARALALLATLSEPAPPAPK